VKKGRHRRYEEARALKRTSDGFDSILSPSDEPCDECGALPGEESKSWCISCKAPSGETDALFPS